MKTTQLTDNLIQLTRYHFVNAYLVREDDGFTLVDAAFPRTGEAFLAAARAAGGPIRRIALTHGHGDHVGSLDELKTTLGDDVEVLMPELDARIHAGETVVDGKLTGSWPTLKTTPDTRINGGDRIGSLEVVPTPGHSPGHVSFLDTRDRSVIVGDVYTSYGTLTITDHLYWRFPFAAMATFDKPQDLDSARIVRGLDPTLMVVGHGPALRSPAKAMDVAIARATH
jgi:glyoxylase-like metal-dependent hydrolase (beta-lactamase superfamily II)